MTIIAQVLPLEAACIARTIRTGLADRVAGCVSGRTNGMRGGWESSHSCCEVRVVSSSGRMRASMLLMSTGSSSTAFSMGPKATSLPPKPEITRSVASSTPWFWGGLTRE
ncbi:hypothetical protein [Nonomuraea sp. NPDC049758]|uniref:hypothetical protein n=1 Tax=Nonomuraea sp. NPDC049758 TaxID=3154360 RepID=UPI00342866E7